MNWDGKFLPPMQKHKAGTGDVNNHFKIAYVVDEAEAADYLVMQQADEREEGIDTSQEYTLEDLTSLGEGRYWWLVGVKFVGDPITYNFIYASDSATQPSEEIISKHVAEYATEVAAAARINGPGGKTAGGLFL